MNRRAFLQSSAAGSAALALPVTQAAADGHATASPPTVLTYKIGGKRVTAMSDGFLTIDAGTLNGVDEAGYRAALDAAHIKADVHPTGVNAFLIEDETGKTLIDAGTGTAFGPTLGHLGAQMEAIGISPDSITRIVATHLHPDHIGGILATGSNPFTAAELVVSENDLGFWMSAEIKAQVPENFHPFFDLAVATVNSFGERVKTVSGEAAIASGLTAMPLPGHTPGHMGVMVEDAGEQLLLWGDIIHVGPVQFADPSVTIAFDADAETASATRAKALDMVTADGLMVAGAHIDFPGIGYVEKAGSGYRWVRAPYPYG